MQPLEWLEPWRELAEADQSKFEDELETELGPAHPLFGIKVKAVGSSIASDDVLFQLQGTKSSYALVHLTWAQRRASGTYPSHEFYNTWEDFVTQRMQDDNFGYDE
ncbi:hypothetical protein KBK19_03890 [Microvirga sp. STR05]|uniref:DUF695 domain-containing protein n=1 Tax=Hymenobacter duratus TaxID=2771356 RepID=A0ABR8JBQ9_9BACT|nr:hypothetical protein [Hymenobacter duratus]MBD2714172.1 hypothetical protein [Hymenobacter duratus]MBR7949074.1 hypothetical protein [Microvirga sp. STR05]